MGLPEGTVLEGRFGLHGKPGNASVGEGGRIIEPLGASTMPQSIMPSSSGFPSSNLDSVAPDSRSAPDLDLDLDAGIQGAGREQGGLRADTSVRRGGPLVVKADGLAAGKGVIIAISPES